MSVVSLGMTLIQLGIGICIIILEKFVILSPVLTKLRLVVCHSHLSRVLYMQTSPYSSGHRRHVLTSLESHHVLTGNYDISGLSIHYFRYYSYYLRSMHFLVTRYFYYLSPRVRKDIYLCTTYIIVTTL